MHWVISAIDGIRRHLLKHCKNEEPVLPGESRNIKEDLQDNMQLEVGNIVEGKVTGITKFGAFVELPGGKTGMVHISEISNTYVKEVSDHLSDGQMVKVKVLSISDDGKISLSIKKCLDPAQQPAPQQTRQEQPRRPFQGNRGGGRSGGIGWNPKRSPDPSEKLDFEGMMANFKKTSEDKMSDLKRGNEVRRSSRRGSSK